jgi:hypothetical protein
MLFVQDFCHSLRSFICPYEKCKRIFLFFCNLCFKTEPRGRSRMFLKSAKDAKKIAQRQGKVKTKIMFMFGRLSHIKSACLAHNMNNEMETQIYYCSLSASPERTEVDAACAFCQLTVVACFCFTKRMANGKIEPRR